ncbi:hypothetical protein KCQ_05496 [Pectobacterium atrosepticum ICMP 1526]|nr:hypothetical protein KCQ_05496 [Pectobacterium atrosepticum ICMP 1526]
MTKKMFTDILIKRYGLSWQGAYYYARTSEWVLFIAEGNIRDDIASGEIYN